jgi:hypothetical protein
VVAGADVVEELRKRPRRVGVLEARRCLVEFALEIFGLRRVERCLRLLHRIGILGEHRRGERAKRDPHHDEDT